MTYMPQFPALQRLHDDTLERLREWLRVHPGDFAARNDSDPPPREATPAFPLLCSTHKQRTGVEL